ncbi:MAG TPA: metal-dependent hydrolase [Verrucomicrobiae bacterium]|nr:metal-dependent hydrolase [Verrucomicrobiae bacterium]
MTSPAPSRPAPTDSTASLESRPEIVVRNISFSPDLEPAQPWLGGDPIASAFFNALSVTFPQGERFFMDSVRRYKGQLPPELAAQASAFVTQEALHTREHVAFNQQVASQGYDVAALEERTRKRLAIARARPHRIQLAVTMALEHFTAILAHSLLARPDYLDGASDEAKALWRWHAIEEIEHKAVAFDVFQAVHASTPAPFRWLRRSISMIAATLILASVIGANMRDLLAQDGIRGFSAWRRSMRYLWFKPAPLRQIAGLYFMYFRPGFHPWSHDDRELIAETDAQLRAAYPLAEAAA